MVVLIIVICLITHVLGHGSLINPPSRNAVDRFLPGYTNGGYPQGSAGCNCSPKHSEDGCDAGVRQSGNGQPCLWFSQGCTIGCEKCDGLTQHTMGKSLCNSTMQPTINDPKLFTMNRWVVPGSINDTYRFNPWRAPGAAPVEDACGMAGGALVHGGGEAIFLANQWAKQGDLGSKVLPSAPSGRIWTAGSQVDVSWGIRFNHGGGYQYRLCPVDSELTEECFQKLPLDFVRENQRLQWNNGTTYPIKGVFVDQGTKPEGSTWAMNPMPRIDFDDHSSGQPKGWHECTRAQGPGCRQFDPPCPWDEGWATVPGSFWGDVKGECSGDAIDVQIVDTVIIPKDITPGNYVLGWRWDCEETAQIWSNCADVTIIASTV